MKQFRGWLLLACVMSVCVADSQAKDLVLDGSDHAQTGISLTADGLSRRAPMLQFSAHVAKLTADVVKTEKGSFVNLAIPGFPQSGAFGAPAIPVLTKLVEVPFGATLKVKVNGRDLTKLSLKTKLGSTAPVMPRQPPHPKDNTVVPFAYDQKAYQAPGFQQEELATVQEVGVMRNMHLVLLKVAPVAYAPATGDLEVYRNVQVELSVERADNAKTLEAKTKYASRYFEALASNVLRPASLAKMGKATRGPISYHIIADRAFEAALKPLVEWKTAKGYKVTVGYTDTVGATSEAIKTYLKGQFANATTENPAPDFVLFVGDNDQIPAFSGNAGSHITDLYFACQVGDDNIPDVVTGRFSAQNVEQLQPQIDKTLQYEKAEFPDPSFLKNTVMIAGWDYSHAVEWGWPQIKFGTNHFFNAAHGLTATSFLSSGSGQNAAEIRAAVSAGAGYVNYTAHGSPDGWHDPGFSNSQVAEMTNAGKYPLMVGNCCLTNKFELDPCFGETLLRAANKGAIGYIGGTNSTYWDEDLWWGNGFYSIKHPNEDGTPPGHDETAGGAYKGMFEGKYTTQGSMIVAGNLAVEASTTHFKKYYWEVYQLMGDPSLRIYWGVPAEAAVQLQNSVPAGTTSLTVNAPAGSYVGVTVNGELVGAGDVEGTSATITTKPLAAGAIAKIVVTGQNQKPYVGQVTVAK